MARYRVDEEDVLFQLRECPGLDLLETCHPSPDCQLDTAEMIFQQISSFAQKVLSPLRSSADQEGCQLQDGRVKVAKGMQEAWDGYRALGLMAMCEEPAWGGAGLPHFFQVASCECECGSMVSFSMLPLLTKEAANLIASFGSQELRQTYLEKMFSGQWSGTMCLTEPQAGSDVGAAKTRAVADGEHYLIQGGKIFITWGEHDLSENIIHLVLARIEGAPAGSRGLSLFVVPKKLPDGTANGVSCDSLEHKMGIHGCPTCVLSFGSELPCKGSLVGEPHHGLAYMFQMMNRARIEVGIQGMAQASAAYLEASAYARYRSQGSRKNASTTQAAAIIDHPDVRRMLLQMRGLVEGGRSLFYHLGLFQDLALHHPRREFYASLVEWLTPIAKSFGSDQGFRVAELAVQVLGGYGYCRDYGVEQYLRDLKIASIYEGTNGIQAIDLVQRKVVGSRGALAELWLEHLAPDLEACRSGQLAEQGQHLQMAHEALRMRCLEACALWAQGAMDAVLFRAQPLMEAASHVVVAGLLLRQAWVSQARLTSGRGTLSEEFYRQKQLTCRSYFDTQLAAAASSLANPRFFQTVDPAALVFP
jgi:alkylation response protein AidB-like acyl-CoA dehydrogenase